MKVNDFLLYTLEGDAANPPTIYVAEIVSIDPGTGAFSFRQADTGQEFVCQLPADVSGSWQGQDGQGADVTINTHNIYTAGGTIDVVFYQQPYHRLSFDNDAITQSDWDAYPVGDQILSIEGYVLDTSLGQPAAGVFNNGWWSLAQQLPAFAGRIGGVIAPFAVVVHTTDMVPETWNVLLHSWTTQLGAGDCAHFIIGRDAAAGMVQLAPITNNANHAGGNGHGSFVAGQQSWHPNTVAVGIEVHCAGSVRQINGDWHLVENGAVQGAAIADEDVIADPQRPGRGWHKVTDYQYEQLGALLDGLENVLAALPVGCAAQSIEQPPAYGIFPTGRRVGHVSLDAAHRGDPWPPTCDWMRARG